MTTLHNEKRNKGDNMVFSQNRFKKLVLLKKKKIIVFHYKIIYLQKNIAEYM